jgi:hypothetical protein
VDVLARFRGSKIRGLVLAHVVVAGAFLLWRALENTPATASAQASTFATTPFGRGLVLALVLASTFAAVVIVVRTWAARREFVAWALFVLWIAALAQRESVDVFDIVYVLSTTIVAAAAFASRRN